MDETAIEWTLLQNKVLHRRRYGNAHTSFRHAFSHVDLRLVSAKLALCVIMVFAWTQRPASEVAHSLRVTVLVWMFFYSNLNFIRALVAVFETIRSDFSTDGAVKEEANKLIASHSTRDSKGHTKNCRFERRARNEV